MNAPSEGGKLNFRNTEFAFAHKSDKALKRTYRLFRMIDSPFLTKVGPPLVTFALKLRLPIEGLIKKTIFDIFCGGTSLEGTRARSEQLFKNGAYTILDYSVEGKNTEESYDATCEEVIRTLQQGAKYEAVAFSAMKVSGIADSELLTKVDAGQQLNAEEQAALARGKARLAKICAVSEQFGQPVFIDAEESWFQDSIDTWAEEMMRKHNREKALIYTTTQMYRHDRLAYLKDLIKRSGEEGYLIGVKVVRGAYIEKENDRAQEQNYPTPMQPNKPATDAAYNAALALCVENVDHVALCAGTHNEDSSALLAELVDAKGIPHDHPHILFAQLLGMSDHISFNLAHHGFRAAKYLPYGPVRAVLPYLFRRADENTSIGGQSSREVELLRMEVKRRKGV